MSSWTLITVTYNNEETLRTFWGAQALPEQVEWIVVDNASSDASIWVAEELGATVIRSATNLGFGRANNIALKRAAGDYVAFVNPDVTVDFASLEQLEREIDRTGGVVAPQLMNPDGSSQPNGRGAPLLLHKIANRLSKELGGRLRYHLFAPADGARYVCWVIGAALAGRAQDFRRLGGWDERYFIYYEDKDICLRAWRHGFPVVLLGSVRWTHGWARETTRLRLRPWLYEVRSASRFYRTYPEFLIGPSLRVPRWREVRARLGQSAGVTAGVRV